MVTKMYYILLISLLTWFTSCFNGNKVLSVNQIEENIKTDNMQTTSFYDLKSTSLDGQSVSMSQFKGKKIVILNVASKCGYTPQYADWQKFYEENNEKIVVLGFPCNQFMGQEPGSAEEIASFCEKNYGVTFPMFEKIDVKGSNQSPIYRWLTTPSENGWNSEVPSWNFCKYLIDENGKLTHFFASKIKPDSPEFLDAIK
mgnify:CR=1 FL=1